jgi:uridine phosphorylase
MKKSRFTRKIGCYMTPRYPEAPSGVAIEPQEFLDYLKIRREVVPETVIICFQPFAVRELSVQRQLVSYRLGTRRAYSRKGAKDQWAIVVPLGIGAPAAVITLEEMIALGVRRFIFIGGAGALQPELSLGDIVLCQGAFRDEGTSGHYLNADHGAYISNEGGAVLGDFSKVLESKHLKYRLGSTWSTDAPYREYWGEVDQYQRAGVLTVDMEASALIAVAKFRASHLVSAFVISDTFANRHWQPGFREKSVAKGLVTLLESACQFAD